MNKTPLTEKALLEVNRENNTTGEVAQPSPISGMGATGGPGMVGTRSPMSSGLTMKTAVSMAEVEDDPILHQVMYNIGATGAMGGRPTELKVEPGKPVSENVADTAASALEAEIAKLSLADALMKLKEQIISGEGIIASARARTLNVAWVHGKLLLHLRGLYISEGKNWVEEIERECPDFPRRTREDYMKIGDTPGILKHAYVGSDMAVKLISVIAPFKHMLDPNDPIGDLYKRNGVNLDYAQCSKLDVRKLVNAVITKEKLAAKGITVSIEVVREFLEQGKKVEVQDVAVMLDRKLSGKDPADYLREVIKLKGVRPNDRAGQTQPKPPIKYVNAESVKFTRNIQALMDAGKDALKRVDQSHLRELAHAVNALIELTRIPK